MKQECVLVSQSAQTIPRKMPSRRLREVTPKILSYHNGVCTEVKVAVCRYPDGTTVVNDGKHCVIQRPWREVGNFANSYSAKPLLSEVILQACWKRFLPFAKFARILLSLISNFFYFRQLFQHL
jgi:hypothetical protein